MIRVLENLRQSLATCGSEWNENRVKHIYIYIYRLGKSCHDWPKT